MLLEGVADHEVADQWLGIIFFYFTDIVQTGWENYACAIEFSYRINDLRTHSLEDALNLGGLD